jgi:flagellar export protein FliJ
MTNGGRVDANTLRLQGVALADGRARAQQIALRLAGVLKRLEAARAELAAKAAERRAIELLKERQLEAFRRDELAKESRVLDDLASSAATRETDR